MTDFQSSNGLIESVSQNDSSALNSVLVSEAITQNGQPSQAQNSVMVMEVISQIQYPSDGINSFIYIEAVVPVVRGHALPIFS